MNILVSKNVILVVFLVVCFPLFAFSENVISDEFNAMVQASVDQIDDRLVVRASVSKHNAESVGQTYASLHVLRDQKVLDEVSATKSSMINENSMEYDFVLNTNVLKGDQFVLVTKNQSGVPVDMDPLDLEIDDSQIVTTSVESLLDIVQCVHSFEDKQLVCDFEYNGEYTEPITSTIYKDSIYGEQLATHTATVTFSQADSAEEKLIIDFSSFDQVTDGLYPYTLESETGRMLLQGSVRVGDIPSPTAEQVQNIDINSTTVNNDIYVTYMMAAVAGFVLLIIMVYVLFVMQGKKKWFGVSLIAILFALLAGYVVYAVSFASTDHPQFQYNVTTTPVSDDVYWLSFSAFDTYTSTAPLNQRVRITYDGVTYTDLINSNTGESSHLRQVTITEAQQATAAIVVVNGCASYYGVTSFGTARYGTFDCDAQPLFPTEDSIIGCLDPAAGNFNPNAVISSGSCLYTGCTIPSAVNYSPAALIDDGSCVVRGCVNPVADNYNGIATTDDGTCLCGGLPCADLYGCTNPSAGNYNPSASIDDGSCDSCRWLPQLPDLTQICFSESFVQTNSCTGATRTQTGSLSDSWQPNLSPSDVCLGETISQTRQCSSVSPAPTRTITGTSNNALCISPTTGYLVSTNLRNWTDCSTASLQFTRSDQVLYVRASGSEPAQSWVVNDPAGNLTGVASVHEDDVWKIDFTYLNPQKRYPNIAITMNSPAGNSSAQTCDISLLDFDFVEQ